ncbi:MAG: hypothetical protein AAF226_03105 [Verrucomicrobiota bacterium]
MQLLKTHLPPSYDWSSFQSLLDRSKDENLDQTIDDLYELVDESYYSLSDWLDALMHFDSWLESKSIDLRPLKEMIGYLHCSQMVSAETLSPPPLPRLVVQMLDDYGFDAAQKIEL